jgi:hypothetical protein
MSEQQTETQNVQNNAELAAFWNTVVPLSEVRTGSAFEPGQYDFAIQALTPGQDKNGKCIVVIDAKCLAPGDIAVLPGKAGVFARTLYFGTNKDPKFTLPETAKNCPALKFLKQIAEINKVPVNDQSPGALCAAISGKTFSVRLDHGDDYKDEKTQTMKKGGLEFGRTVTPVGTIPARLDRVAASATTASAAPATAAPVGATFD